MGSEASVSELAFLPTRRAAFKQRHKKDRVVPGTSGLIAK